MNATTLKDFLASVIAEQLAPSAPSPAPGASQRGGEPATPKPVAQPSLPALAEKMADELVKEAFASGLPLTHQKVEKGRLGGGNTAEVVAQVTLHAPFAFKFDQATKKLAEEGETMRKIKRNALPGINLPARFRDAWPVIYAVRHEPVFAYLMEFFPKEDGWLSLEDRLYPAGQREPATLSDAVRWIHTVLDILFTGYEASANPRHNPSLIADYLERIRVRVTEVAERDERFASRALVVNGQRLRPWKRYLDEIERHYLFLHEIAPPFTTVTHGDPNPGNLMLRTTTAEVEMKLIDPKDWMTGDYLFDLCKITHFLEGTGPVEKPAEGGPVRAAFRLNGSEGELSYAFGQPTWTAMLVEACRERVARFAAAHKDPHWRVRYELGMAANFLALPIGRLEKGREHAALILFGEGMKWLDRFCARLGAARSQAVVVAEPDDLEPAPLRPVREWVRVQVPGVREAEDRRGFQLLQWDPVRANDAGKPAELSLEHEARLLPMDERAATKLLEALIRSEGRRVGDGLLKPVGKEESPFAELVVRRYDREPGAQSVDRYYDVPVGGAEAGLISRMITIRERLRWSKFMTWGTANDVKRPLNLELPFVALGDSGVTARLEFNWIDDLQTGLREALAADTEESVRRRNPFFMAMQMQGLSLTGLVPVLEHTAYRQKFGLWQPGVGGAEDREVFAVNLDTVVAQDLETKRIGTYCDVDMVGMARVDAAELRRLTEFAEAVASRYGLQPNPSTKAYRDAEVTGLLARLKGT